MAEIDRENVGLRQQVNFAQVSEPVHGELIEGEGIEFVNTAHAEEKVASPLSDIIGSGPNASGISHL